MSTPHGGDRSPQPGYRCPPGGDRLAGLPFLWGAGTSAHQVEGGNLNNDWADWETRHGSPCAERTGAACEHLTRYGEDIAHLAALGLNCYRFSVEWSRIEPQPGRFERGWLDHYAAMLRCCRRNGLRAALTLHHFTNPRWIADAGGWENPETAVRFGRYCAVLGEALGEAADLIITINEPNMPPLLGYELGVFPPGRRDRDARRRVTDVYLDGHARAVAALRAACPGRPVGLALAMADWQAPPGAEAALQEHRHLREDVFLTATAGDDFVGVNTYTRHRLGPEGWLGNEPGVELTAAGYEFWPEALEATLRRAAELSGRPLIVTESGIATDDDTRRVEFVERAVASMRRGVADGIDVRGYLYWSALDNYEWQHGYSQRFGLIGVDRATQARTIRPSAWRLGELARRHQVAARAGRLVGERGRPAEPGRAGSSPARLWA